MQIPILSGVAADERAEFIQTHPLNLEPVIIDSKISRGMLRPTAGAEEIGTGPGVDRGGILWKGVHYRVMGTKLVTVAPNGTVTVLGDVGGEGPVRLDYGFDRLGIRSGNKLRYWTGSALIEVTDEDLGPVVDAMWIGGYWMTTDGTSVIVTELSDPTAVHPLKYGSSEEDPDEVTGLMKVRAEAYVLNRHTIQPFRNVGGNGFPFQAVPGATIPYGCVSADAKCPFAESFAFVGSARNGALRVYLASQGTATAISTRTVEDALASVADCYCITMESRSYREEDRLFLHLPTETWVFCLNATAKAQQPVWYRAQSGIGQAYRLRNAVLVGDSFVVGDTGSAKLGRLSEETDHHFGEAVQWRFDAGLIYGEGRAGVIHSLELVGLPGRGESEGMAFLSMSKDGQTWSVERELGMGKPGERRKRLQWRPHTRFSNWIGLRFRGIGGMPAFARLEADVRPMG